MTLLDTNILIYASNPNSSFWKWARQTIGDAVAGDGAAVNAVSLAELYVGAVEPSAIARQLRSWGISILDIPAAAAGECAEAYRQFRTRRLKHSEKLAPNMPLPDFFIGAHAMVMGWDIATADQGRFSTYFPSVNLKLPKK